MSNKKKYTSFKYGLFEKMLDEWLGVDRNGETSETVIKSYDDPRVCKWSLAGCCPFSLLENTRMTRGPCKYEVCPCPSSLREQYIADNQGLITSYDQALFDLLDKIVIDADRRISISKNFQQSKPSDIQINPELRELDSRIHYLLDSSRKHGENGEVSIALSELSEVDSLRRKRKQKEQELMRQTQEKERQVHVCEICTAVIQQSDQEGRMAEHNLGRQHVAYMTIRETHEMLKSKGVVSKRYKYGNAPLPRSKVITSGSVRRLVPLDVNAQ